MYFACWSKIINIEKEVLHQVKSLVFQKIFCKMPWNESPLVLDFGNMHFLGGENWKVSKKQSKIVANIVEADVMVIFWRLLIIQVKRFEKK